MRSKTKRGKGGRRRTRKKKKIKFFTVSTLELQGIQGLDPGFTQNSALTVEPFFFFSSSCLFPFLLPSLRFPSSRLEAGPFSCVQTPSEGKLEQILVNVAGIGIHGFLPRWSGRE